MSEVKLITFVLGRIKKRQRDSPLPKILHFIISFSFCQALLQQPQQQARPATPCTHPCTHTLTIVTPPHHRVPTLCKPPLILLAHSCIPFHALFPSPPNATFFSLHLSRTPLHSQFHHHTSRPAEPTTQFR